MTTPHERARALLDAAHRSCPDLVLGGRHRAVLERAIELEIIDAQCAFIAELQRAREKPLDMRAKGV
jgi:hypothetical protein